ncbi:MAG: alpha/beta hydrolase [Pirellulales bacterium]
MNRLIIGFTATWITLGAAVVAPAVEPPASADKQDGVKRVLGVPYGDDERQRLDLYLPEGVEGYPTLVFVHGGGYSKGDRRDVAGLGETLAQRGIGVVAVGYRLHPQVKHPEQIQDIARAFAAVREHVGRHGGRANALFVGGHSAGAQLAALLGVDSQYLGHEKLKLDDIRGVVALSGGYRLDENRADVFGDAENRAGASPINQVRRGAPAFFLGYADNDSPGREDLTREFAAALEAQGVPVQVVKATGRNHGTLFTGLTSADPTLLAIADFIRRESIHDRD